MVAVPRISRIQKMTRTMSKTLRDFEGRTLTKKLYHGNSLRFGAGGSERRDGGVGGGGRSSSPGSGYE
jgi:hypothetical protein